MKNTIFFMIYCSLSIFSLSSCKYENDQPVETTSSNLFEILTSPNNIKVDGNITLVATDLSFSRADVDAIDLTGYFLDKNGKAVNVDRFSIGQYDVPEEPNGRYYLHFGASHQTDISDVVSNLLGKPIDFLVSSKVFGDAKAKIYVPKPLETKIEGVQDYSISLSKPLKINWSPDNLLLERTGTEKVGVAIVYHAGFSINYEQKQMPTQNITVSKLADDVSGTVTFTPQDLAVFPEGSYVVVYNGRAQQEIITTSTGQKIAITNFVMTSSTDLKIRTF